MGTPTSIRDETLVLYDEDCGFCRWSADRLRAWDRAESVAFRSIQAAERAGMLETIEPVSRYASWHVVTPDGRIWSGGAAVPPLTRRLPGGRALAAIAEAFPDGTDHLYRFLARHRDRFGTALGQRACAVDPSREGRRDAGRART
ncbi:MAG: thiol-disulfide oxidoreductase DCC family protein [Actinomycetota bacterium]